MATPQEKSAFITLTMHLIQSLQMSATTGANVDLSKSNIRSLFGPDDICVSACDKAGNTAFISSLGRNHSQEVIERFRGGYSRHGVQYEAGWLLSAGVNESINDVAKALGEYFAKNYRLDFLGSADSVAMTTYYHRSMAVKNFIQQCKLHFGPESYAVNSFSTVSRTNSGNWGISSFFCVSMGDVVLNVEYSQDGILGRMVPVHTEEQIHAACAIAMGAMRTVSGLINETPPLWDIMGAEEKNQIRAKVMQTLINPKITGKVLHENWRRTMEISGWRYNDGDLCPVQKFHPHLVDFEALPRSEQIKNDLFISGAIAGLKLQNLLV